MEWMMSALITAALHFGNAFNWPELTDRSPPISIQETGKLVINMINTSALEQGDPCSQLSPVQLLSSIIKTILDIIAELSNRTFILKHGAQIPYSAMTTQANLCQSWWGIGWPI